MATGLEGATLTLGWECPLNMLAFALPPPRPSVLAVSKLAGEAHFLHFASESVLAQSVDRSSSSSAPVARSFLPLRWLADYPWPVAFRSLPAACPELAVYF